MQGGKTRVLMMVEWFAPGYKAGGPIQSCVNLCKALQHTHELYVITSDTDHQSSTPYAGVQSDEWIRNDKLGCNIFYLSAASRNFATVKRLMAAVNPGVVYLNLMYAPLFVIYPLLLKRSGWCKAKVVLAPRGCLYDSAINIKRYKKLPMLWLYCTLKIHRLITFHATNEREALAIDQYFPGANTVTANNLPSMLQEPLVPQVKGSGELKLIFVARIVPIKNLLFLLQCLTGVKGKVVCTIAGPAEDEAYWQQCQQVIKQLPVNISCNYIGPVENEKLPPLVRQHHLFVSPSTGENFGHAIFESLLTGRPVVISDQTPWTNLSDANAGWVLPLSQPEAFTQVLQGMVDADQARFDSLAEGAWQFASNFLSNKELVAPYLQLFRENDTAV